jgi:hypothetical protein
MPTEFRRVVFPNQELRQALSEYEAQGNEPVPAGEVVAVAILDKPAEMVRITLLDTTQNATFTADFPASYIAAALIHFCIEHKVPIPRNSRKSLRLMGDNLALDIVVRERKLVDIDTE